METIFYMRLNETDRKNYDAIVRAIRTMQRSVSLYHPATSLLDLFQDISDSHPEFFYLSRNCRETLEGEKVLYLNYIYTPLQIRKLTRDLEQKADEILRTLMNAHQSDYDKVLIIHDYLKSTISYDSETYKQLERGRIGDLDSYTIVGGLLRHKCVCEGFANTMKYLCDKIGIECHIVHGGANNGLYSGSHSWNIVKINGIYQHVDVTWDNQESICKEIPNYCYLNLDDETISRDHSWNRDNYPKCDTDSYNYFKVNGASIDSGTQLVNFLYNNFECEEPHIIFQIVKGSRLESEIRDTLDELIRQAISKCKYVRVSNWTFNMINEQLVCTVEPEYS